MVPVDETRAYVYTEIYVEELSRRLYLTLISLRRRMVQGIAAAGLHLQICVPEP